MSTSLIELCGCVGKVAFDTYDLARKAVQRGRKGTHSIRRDVYHCKTCGKYHAGQHSPTTKAKKRLRRRILELEDEQL